MRARPRRGSRRRHRGVLRRPAPGRRPPDRPTPPRRGWRRQRLGRSSRRARRADPVGERGFRRDHLFPAIAHGGAGRTGRASACSPWVGYRRERCVGVEVSRASSRDRPSPDPTRASARRSRESSPAQRLCRVPGPARRPLRSAAVGREVCDRDPALAAAFQEVVGCRRSARSGQRASTGATRAPPARRRRPGRSAASRRPCRGPSAASASSVASPWSHASSSASCSQPSANWIQSPGRAERRA